ncbi:MAG: phosphotransferase family protein [Casimicrobiaceae bacterium]
MNLDDPGTRAAVEAFLAAAAAARAVRVECWTKLTGGAIQENLLVECVVVEGKHAGNRQWVLRTDAPSAVATSGSRAEEFALLGLAHAAGVAVPTPCFLHAPGAGLPAFFVMEYCEGVAAGHLLTKDGAIADPAGLLRDVGANLARIHAIAVPTHGFAFLGPATGTPTRDYLAGARAYLDHWRSRFGDVYPALEWGIHGWLARAPDAEDVVLAHRDFRIGNLLVAGSRLRAIFDWEFAGWANPLEDLGWLCAPCWRFNARQRVAGGIGAAADLLAGYNAVRGTRWREQDLVPWQALAQIRWAIIALQQAERYLGGGERSLELALTGRLVPELEHDLLALLARWETMRARGGAS